MTRTTTAVGRAQLPHPDLNYDTDDGGTQLHDALASIWTSVSNHLPSRWTGDITLANTATTTVTHNFNLAIAKLKVIIFESGTQLTAAQVTAAYTIAQVSVNAISIQNTSGGPKTFQAMIFAMRYGIVAADADPTFNPGYSTDGETGNSDYYKSSTATIAATSTYRNMIVLGDLVLNANLTIQGNLFLTGQIQANGFKFDCNGDVIALNGASITGSNMAFTIRGSLFSGADWTSTNNGASQPTFSIGKDFFAVDVPTGTLKAIVMNGTAASGTLALPGYILRVGGNLIVASLNLAGGLIGTNVAGGVGGQLFVGGSVKATGAFTVAGGAGNGTGAAGAGGTVTVTGDFKCGALTSTGGASGASSVLVGGAGGAIVVRGSAVLTSIAAGGGSGNSTAASGAGGAVTVDGDLTTTSTITTAGPAGAASGAGGGAGGAIAVGGDLNAGDSVTTNGGNSGGGAGGFGGIGGAITVKGDFTCAGTAITLATGTQSASTTTIASVGGALAVSGDLYAPAAAISTRGMDSVSTNAKTDGGAVTIGGNCLALSMRVDGGTNSSSASPGGGFTGQVLIRGNLELLATGSAAFTALAGSEGAVGATASIAGQVRSIEVIGNWTMRGQVTIQSGTIINKTALGNLSSGRAIGADPIVICRGNINWMVSPSSGINHTIAAGDWLSASHNDATATPGMGPGLMCVGHCTILGTLNTRGSCASNATPAASVSPIGLPSNLMLLGGCNIAKYVGDWQGNGPGNGAVPAGTDVWIFGGMCCFGYLDASNDTIGNTTGKIQFQAGSQQSGGRGGCFLIVDETSTSNITIWQNNSVTITAAAARLPRGFRGAGANFGAVLIGRAGAGSVTSWTPCEAYGKTNATTWTFNGTGGTSASANVRCFRSGGQITLHIEPANATSGTTSTAFTSNTAIDVEFRPVSQVLIPVANAKNNGVLAAGILTIQTNGIMVLQRDQAITAFTNATSCGFTAGSACIATYIAG